MQPAQGHPADDVRNVDGKRKPGLTFAARWFGWFTLFGLAALMVNNILSLSFGFPEVSHFSFQNPMVFAQIGLYLAAAILAYLWAKRTADKGLKVEAKQISDFNAYVIRGCFFAVLFVGLADATISILRVENILELILSEQMAKDLVRVHFIGPYIHIPLIVLGFVVALFSRTLGFHWLALLIVVAELIIVIARFLFSYEQALMGDLVRYWYASLFLFASAYTLLQNEHVRVDVLYAGFSERRKGAVNGIGTILLGMLSCWVIIYIGFGHARAIINSPVMNFEISQTGTAGMYIKYQMAAFLGIYAITMLIQFVSFFFDAVADYRDGSNEKVTESDLAAEA